MTTVLRHNLSTILNMIVATPPARSPVRPTGDGSVACYNHGMGSRFQALYTRGVLGLLALAGGGFSGLQLSRWRGVSRAAGQIRFPPTPDPAVAATWTGLFEAARKEIWISAGRIDSEAILDALGTAGRRGVRVHVTLSPTQNPDPEVGGRAWLRYKTVLRDVRICASGFEGTACVVDDTYSVVTAQGLLPASASASDASFFLYATDPAMARALRDRLIAQHASATAESPPP